MRAPQSLARRANFGCVRVSLLLSRAVPASIWCCSMLAPTSVMCVPNLMYSLASHVLQFAVLLWAMLVPLAQHLVYIGSDLEPVPCLLLTRSLRPSLVTVVSSCASLLWLVLLIALWM
jgi:hypothetical protein